MNTRDIRIQWRELAEQPLRQRDIASHIGISESELVASRVGVKEPENETIQLDITGNNIENLLSDLPQLGSVMALTRNEQCVYQKKGPYEKLDISPHVISVLGEKIDLRIFQKRWTYGFSIIEKTIRGIQHSFQFYLADGSAAHKIFLQRNSNQAAFFEISKRYASKEQCAGSITTQPLKPEYALSTNIDIPQFHSDWKNLTHTHEFFGLIKRHGISRTQALNLAPPGYATKLNNNAIQNVLEWAALEKISLMLFVSNYGCIQIHTGIIKNIKPMEMWLSIMDQDIELHLRKNDIAETWIVRKSTNYGTITSLELFNAAGDIILQVFGQRTPEGREQEKWRAYLEELEQTDRA